MNAIGIQSVAVLVGSLSACHIEQAAPERVESDDIVSAFPGEQTVAVAVCPDGFRVVTGRCSWLNNVQSPGSLRATIFGVVRADDGDSVEELDTWTCGAWLSAEDKVGAIGAVAVCEEIQ